MQCKKTHLQSPKTHFLPDVREFVKPTMKHYVRGVKSLPLRTRNHILLFFRSLSQVGLRFLPDIVGKSS